MLGDRAAAEDVVQEAFRCLYRRRAFLLDKEFSAPTGKATGVIHANDPNGPNAYNQLYWSDTSGNVLVVTGSPDVAPAQELYGSSAEASSLQSREPQALGGSRSNLSTPIAGNRPGVTASLIRGSRHPQAR